MKTQLTLSATASNGTNLCTTTNNNMRAASYGSKSSTHSTAAPSRLQPLAKHSLRVAFLLLAMMVSAFYAWGTEVSVSISSYASTNSWANGTAYATINIDSNVSATGLTNGNNSKYYSSNTSWRHYEGDGGTITIATSSGTLSSVTFTYSNGNSGVIKNGSTNVNSGSACSISGTSVTFSVGHSSGSKKGNVQITSISVTYTPGGSSYTITATSNNTSYGTVSLSGTTITATPNTGYRVKSGTEGYTVTSGSATVTNNGDNTFSITPTSNCTVRINFEAIPTYTVTFNKGTGTCSTTSLPEASSGAGVTLPAATPSSTCESAGWTFAGWAESEVTSTTTSPTLVGTTGGTYHPTSNITLYAVYKVTEGGGGSSASVSFKTDGSESSTERTTDEAIKTNIVDTYSGISSFAGSKLYCGGANGAKLGSSGSNGYITSNLSSSVTTNTITVEASQYGTDAGNLTVTVNGSTTFGSEIAPSTGTCVFTHSSSIAITSVTVATTSKRAYLTSITIGEAGTTTWNSNPSCAAPTACATPTFSVSEGTYNANQSVTISCTTTGATIYYTTDGSTPTTSSNLYSSAVSITQTTTLKAIAVKSGLTNSSEASATYTLKCATPTFTPAAGSFTSAQNVSISCTSTGAAIHYTTNGSTPTGSSTTYSSAIAVSTTTTIKAIATKTGWSDSDEASGTFSIVAAETYELVTDASSLAAGDEIIFVDKNCGYALSTTQNTNNRPAVAASGNFTYDSSSETILVISADVQVIVLGESNGNWTLGVGSDFLYAAGSGSGKNYLKTQSSNDANGEWEITITSNVASFEAQGTNTNNVLQFNNGSSKLFSCYSSASQTDVKIFRKEDADKCKTPTFTPAAGTYNVTQTVTISCATAGATIYYTTDGSTPSASSTEYTSAISITSTTTIKAIAVKSGMTNSAVATALYTINTGGGGGSDCNIFHETWDNTSGSGGNDGSWSGSIAQSDIYEDNNDENNGWFYAYARGADQCIKIGSSSKGSATTPEIAYSGSGELELTFKAAAWDGSSEKLTVNLSATNATLSQSSITLVKGEWTTYNLTISNITTGFTITWEAAYTSNNRFFLDEVCISESCTPPSTPLSINASLTTMTSAESSTLSTEGGNGNEVTYSVVSANAASATITGSTFNAYAAGTYTVQARQDKNGDVCSQTAAVNITVSLAPITVTLSRNGETENVANVAVGTALDAIDGTGDQGGCAEWTFIGWTKTERTDQETSDPMTLVTEVDGAGPYYAVYKYEAGAGAGSTYNFSSSDETAVGNGSAITIATGITARFQQADNPSSAPYFDGNAIRVYYKNTITIASSGANLTRIEFLQSSGSNTISPSVGSITGLVWTGDANSVTFTLGGTSGHRKITGITIGGGGTVYYSTAATCGPNIKITGSSWVTSTKGQTIKAILTVRAGMFNGAATMTATSSNSSIFKNSTLASAAISAGGSAETTLTVEYAPTATTDGTEQTTLTVRATDPSEGIKTATFTLHGRHLPDKFVMVAKCNDKWYALPANMSGADKYEGIEVTVNNNENPTSVAVAPYNAIYSIAAVNSANYSGYGNKVRFVGNLSKMLWGTDSNSAGTINNNAQYGIPSENTTHNYEWTIESSDGINYTLQNVAYDIKEGNTAGYHSLKYFSTSEKFGMYVNGEKNFRFLPVGCSTKPYVTNISTTATTATITWTGDPSVTYNLFVKKNGTEVTSLRQTAIESPVTIENLTGETTYTYIISPSTISDACALSAELTTAAAPISFTLSRRGRTETISNVEKPYPLPTSDNACDEWVFVGWSATSVTEGAISFTNVTHATTDGATYYAVYKKTSGGGSTEYTRVTSASQLADGKVCVIAYYDDDEDEGICLGSYNDNGYFEQNTASTFNADGSKITSLGEGTMEFIINSVSGGAWTFTNSAETLTATKVKKLALSSTTGYNTWYISISSGLATIENVNSGMGYIKFNTLSPRFTNYLASAQNMGLPSLYVGGTGAIYSSSATSCVDCSSAGAYFRMGNEVKRNTESDNFTNEVLYEKTNTSAKEWSSSNDAVATVNATTGEVTIIGEGTATITMKQNIDTSNDPDNVCAVKISYSLIITKPTVEVVEVTADDEIIIEHDLDGDSKLILSELVEGMDGNIADDVFISKYFEAASNMKLFGIYNGTLKYVDLTKLRIRSNADATTWASSKGSLGYLEFKDVKKLGTDFKDFKLPPGTEIIFWSNNYGTPGKPNYTYNGYLRECVNMTINGVNYDYYDMESGQVPHWYCLGDPENYNKVDSDGNNQFVFNGDDGLILERTEDGGLTWEPIDLFGAGDKDAPVSPKYVNKNQRPSDSEGNGKIKVVDGNDTEKYTINETANTPLNDNPGGFWAKVDGIDIPLSTNRYYLVRKNSIKSGYDAVANNTERFATLETEWTGEPVGGVTGSESTAYCYSGQMFSEVGQYDFASYYANYEDLSLAESDFDDKHDGTWSVHVPNLANYSCKIIRVEVRDATPPYDVKARYDYQVPIIVKEGTKTTLDEIFTNHDVDECASCNVVVLNGATLQKAATGTINEVYDIEVYPGGKLDMQTGRELSVNQLIMRSREDVVSRAATYGTLNRSVSDIYFDKRITGQRWYWFTLPFDCDIADICYRNPEAAAPIFGVDYNIKYYDGATRATGVQTGNWKQFEGTTLKAGVGYILCVNPQSGHVWREIRFPMKNANLEDDSRDVISVPVKAFGATTDVRPNHLGWNLVGNPYLNDYKKGNITTPLSVGTYEKEIKDGRWTGYWNLNSEGEKGLRYVVVPTEGGYGDYEQVAIGTKDLEPFMSYFVQIDGTTDGEELNVEFAETNLTASSIRRRMVAEEYDNPISWVGVRLSNSNQESDETVLLVHNSFTDGYDMMDDLVKWRGDRYSRYSKPVLASRNNEGEMAFNALSVASAEAGIPLNYFAAAKGEYTFSLSDGYDMANVEKVELLDSKLQTTTDLMWSDYTFESERTDDQSRFYLSVHLRKSPDITTSTETFQPLSDIMIVGNDGQLMIRPVPGNANVWVYTADGKLISHVVSGSEQTLIVSVPQNGVYNIRIESTEGSQSFKTIVK